jgi:hypothetical protein
VDGQQSGSFYDSLLCFPPISVCGLKSTHSYSVLSQFDFVCPQRNSVVIHIVTHLSDYRWGLDW